MTPIERIRQAIAAYTAEHHYFPGRWVADDLGEIILLSWEGQSDDSRVAGMDPSPPPGCEPIPADAPWRQWGGDEIIKAAEMPTPQYAGQGQYALPFDGAGIVTQWVGWDA